MTGSAISCQGLGAMKLKTEKKRLGLGLNPLVPVIHWHRTAQPLLTEIAGAGQVPDTAHGLS